MLLDYLTTRPLDQMKPASFDYLAPASLAEALALKAQHGDDAKFLAGGQSLIPAMNFRLVQAALLIDVNGLTGLDGITVTEGDLHLGALCRHRALERAPAVTRYAPTLAEALPLVAHPQIRNRGTLGGSLAHADPAAELPVIALALDARFKIQSAHGERWVAARDFFKGLFTTDLAPDEMLTEVALPPLPSRTGSAFIEFSRRRGDYALMGVAALVTLTETGHCQSARLVFLNAGDGPMDAPQAAALLAGQALTAASIAAVAHAIDSEINPSGNVHASVEYQRHLARVLTKRALTKAFERASS